MSAPAGSDALVNDSRAFAIHALGYLASYPDGPVRAAVLAALANAAQTYETPPWADDIATRWPPTTDH